MRSQKADTTEARKMLVPVAAEPREDVLGFLRLGCTARPFGDIRHGRGSIDHAVQPGNRYGHTAYPCEDVGSIGRPAIEHHLEWGPTPEEDGDRKKDPRYPGINHFPRCQREVVCRSGSAFFFGKFPGFHRMPKAEENRQDDQRAKSAGDIHQGGAMQIGSQTLDCRKAAATDEDCWPRAEDSPPASHRPDKPGGDDE